MSNPFVNPLGSLLMIDYLRLNSKDTMWGGSRH
jgi:hypothetical protein